MSRRLARCAALLAAIALLAPVPFAPSRTASAQDKKDPDKQKEEEEKERKRKEREKARKAALKSIAGEFAAKATSSLLARVTKDQKITLSLGDGDSDYTVTQAKGVLDKYFDNLQDIKVETDSDKFKVDGSVGIFSMSSRAKGQKKDKSGTLYVTVAGIDATPSFALVKLRVDQR